jgi:hypothetical protein
MGGIQRQEATVILEQDEGLFGNPLRKADVFGAADDRRQNIRGGIRASVEQACKELHPQDAGCGLVDLSLSESAAIDEAGEELRGKTPRILQGKQTDHAVVGLRKQKLLKREVFHGQTWNYRKNGEPFLMNWFCYAIYGERGKPIYYVAEQEDVTELETLRLKARLLANPQDPEANQFFAILEACREGGQPEQVTGLRRRLIG